MHFLCTLRRSACGKRLTEVAVEEVNIGTQGEAGAVLATQHWTCTALRPMANRRDATVWRKVWKPAHSTPASAQAGATTRRCRCAGS